MGQVEVWMGRAGSGKSQRIVSEICAELARSPFGAKIIWLVPGDASYATERMLMRAVPASIRCEVMTVQRLAERANQALGVTAGATPVNTTGKRLTLAHVYQQVVGQLQVLQRVYPSIAFLDAILEVFDEMSAHLVALDHVEAALEVAAARVTDLEDVLAAISGQSLLGKLRDLCLLYVHWNRALQEKSLYNPSDLVSWVGNRIGAWAEMQGATVYIDGFDDIPPRDLDMMLALSESALKTVITLSMDASWLADGRLSKQRVASSRASLPSRKSLDDQTPPLVALLDGLPNPGDVYAPQTLQLYHRIFAGCAARSVKIGTLQLVRPADLQGKAPALDVLERHLFRDFDPEISDEEGIRWIAAQNVRTEADGVAQEISTLIHRHGVRYDDVVVLVPNVADYAAHLRDSFAKYGVPHYMDDFPSFATHPLAKFVLAAVQVIEDGFATESLVRLLKTDFCGLERDEADWLETHMRRYEISGMQTWAHPEPWSHAHQRRGVGDRAERVKRDDQRADGLRRTVAAYLLPLASKLAEESCSPRRFAETLWHLMEQVQAKRVVAEWMVNEEAVQSPHEASLHEQAWQRMMGLLSDLTETSVDGEVPLLFLVQVVKGDITHQSLSSIPAGVNEVLVTDISRARAFTSKVVFIMGAVDGAFPRRIHGHGLLQDEERSQFRRLFVQDIGFSVEERQLCERSTLYHAVTRATQRLYFTYPLSNGEGKAIRPSLILGKARTLFTAKAAQERIWTGSVDPAETALLTTETALDLFVSALRQGCDGGGVPPALSEVFRWFSGDDGRRARLTYALRGLTHQTWAQAISPTVARALYGNPMKMNVYQLETFAACPYQHFAKYGLRLSEEVTPDITAAARGTLLHDVLLGFVEKHMGDVVGWRQLTDVQVVESMTEVFTRTLEMPQSAGWMHKHTRRQQAMEVLGVLEHASVVLTRHARHGLFAPVAMELSFGDGGETSLPGYDIEVGDGTTVSLRGRIDRVDVASDGDLSAFRIIDYKSSEMDIDLNKVHHGLRLQLPVYAAVIEHHSEQLFGVPTVPAAMIYVPVVRRAMPRLVPLEAGAAREESLKKMRARGLMVHHPQFISWMDERLTSGGDSELFPSVYKKDGDLYKTAPTIAQDEWRLLLNRALLHVSTMAERIQSGDISIAPYQLTPQDQACTFCHYAAVCQIDKRWDTRPVRFLEKYSKDQVRAIWTRHVGQGVEL